jgi:hypothetical protein
MFLAATSISNVWCTTGNLVWYIPRYLSLTLYWTFGGQIPLEIFVHGEDEVYSRYYY